MQKDSSDELSTQVAVIGGGPIGIETAVALQLAGVDYELFEAKQIGETISRWPRNTHFFSTPERIAISGVPLNMPDQQNPTGEQYLSYLRGVVTTFNIHVNNYEQVESITKKGGDFTLQTRTLTGQRTWHCKTVILATGGMAHPRQLHIPGENLPHVSHGLDDPHRYFQRTLLVVGGRNSAIESTMRCWRAGAKVTLSYYREELPRPHIKPSLRDDIDTVLRENLVRFIPASVPMEIHPGYVILARTRDGMPQFGNTIRVESDFVLLATGFEADMSLFAQLGVSLQGENGTPFYEPSTMETNVEGVYVAGTAAGGTQNKFEHFIETSHAHVDRILRALTGQPAARVGYIIQNPDQNVIH
jgi:thioredoxin reductase (NADPH)